MIDRRTYLTRCVQAAASVAGLSFVSGCSPTAATAPTTPSDPADLPPVSLRELLQPGEPLPVLRAEGWLNGNPPDFQQLPPEVRGVVVDVSAMWCPVCKQTAPSLVILAKHYQPLGIRFVTIMGDYRGMVEQYITEQQIFWPTGYRATQQMLADLGAFHRSRVMPGAEGAPTVYVVDRAGIVRWNDAQARLRHRPPAEQVRKLDAAIQALLAPNPEQATPGSTSSSTSRSTVGATPATQR